MEYVGIVIVLVLAQYFYFATAVAVLRQKVGTPATDVATDETLKRTIRVQLNTLEWLVVFLPVLVLCGYYLDGRIAAGLGLVWIIGRFMYQHGYLKDAKSRGPGFVTCLASCGLLALGALYGMIRALIA